MKHTLIAVVVGFCTLVQAKEITWTGSVDTDFATAGNWTGGAPAAGDVAKFTANATITGSFDFGADGFTLDVASDKTLTCKVAFGGVGRLTKTGAGIIKFTEASNGTFTGGLRIEGGRLVPANNNSWNMSIGGTGNVVELLASGLATDPFISFSWGSVLNTPVSVIGVTPGRSVVSFSDTSTTLKGNFQSAVDAQIDAHYGTDKLLGNIDCGAHTLTIYTKATGIIGASDNVKKINGSVACYGSGLVKIYSQGTNTADTLSVSNSVFLYNSWAGNAIVSGESAVLTVGKDGTTGGFAGSSSVVVENGATLCLSNGVALSVRSLSVNGASIARGTYTVDDLPDAVVGEGTIQVGYKCWCGGNTGKLSEPSNWSDGLMPSAGDELVFNQNVTLEDEDFALVGAGLALAPAQGVVVTCHTDFSGSGGLSLSGRGSVKFDQKSNGTFTGGVRVLGGSLKVGNPGTVWSLTVGDPSNVVEVVLKGSETDPSIELAGFSCGLNNPVKVSGVDNIVKAALYGSDSGSFNCNIEGLVDFVYCGGAASRRFTLDGDVNAIGHTLYMKSSVPSTVMSFGLVSDSNWSYSLKKSIAGSLTTCGGGKVLMYAKGTDIDSTLTVQTYTELYNSWAGTNVVIDGATLVATNISRAGVSIKAGFAANASLRIQNGGKLVMGDGVVFKFGEMIVNGVPVAKGAYTAADFVGSIEGRGTICVGTSKEWIGGASGLLRDGDNWSDGKPAQTGDVLLFGKSVTLLAGETAFDLANDNLTFVVADGYTVVNQEKYGGAGRLVKMGLGTFDLRTSNTGTFTGGVKIMDGKVNAAANSGWGTSIGDGKGEFTIVLRGDNRPQLCVNDYGARLNNPVFVTGENGHTNYSCVTCSNRGGYKSSVRGDVDFAFAGGYHTSYVFGELSSPGHLVTIRCGAASTDEGVTRTSYLKGAIDASICKSNTARLEIAVGTTNAVNSLTVAEGPVFLTKEAKWAGTNVVVNGAGAELMVSAAQNLSRKTEVALENGGKLYVTNGVLAKILGLTVNGVQMPFGTYTAANLPDAISGEGRVRVGVSGLMLIVR